MEQLERFISDNREAFDSERPPASVWQSIEATLEERDKPTARVLPLYRRPMLRRLAAAVVLLVIGIGIGWQLNDNGTDAALVSLTDVSPEYAELETYYQTQVSMRMQQLVNYRQISDVQPDLEALDEVYLELQQELENAPSGSEDRIIQAMIDNYRAKLSILERVLDRVQYTNPELTNPENDHEEISI